MVVVVVVEAATVVHGWLLTVCLMTLALDLQNIGIHAVTLSLDFNTAFHRMFGWLGCPLFLSLTLLVGHQEEHLARKKIECWGTSMVICLECGANDLLYGPADATATPSSLASVKSTMVYLSRAGLPRLSWKKGH